MFSLHKRVLTGLTAAVLTLGIAPLTNAAYAQNAVQRHPTATGVAAGVATHHLLKRSAANKKAHHQHLNFAERHPTLTGIGAAIGAHHAVKASTHHHFLHH